MQTINSTEIAAIWDQIKHRKDVISVHNLHFVKVRDAALKNPHLITWDFHKKEVNISEVPYINTVDDEPINLSDYKYLWVKTGDPKNQALFRILMHNDDRSFDLKTLFHPAHQQQELKVNYLAFNEEPVEV
ncbi:hypothetical protein [Flammeovirga pacifica]|uniref:Uncharacterized protein n=1 Tax=Flammeovirga pacifica TaxID=915059 RepID=A0A1S1YYP6_FLAPC|nr:hypothetical protein [Flammeovirga pacifica]OHX66053.1 hypothetical protein NH26_06660 [Flammeovirga pacifica]